MIIVKMVIQHLKTISDIFDGSFFVPVSQINGSVITAVGIQANPQPKKALPRITPIVFKIIIRTILSKSKMEVREAEITSISQLIGWLILIVFSNILASLLGLASDKTERKRALLNLILFSAGVLCGILYWS